VRQQFIIEVGKFTTFGIKFLQDVVYQKLLKPVDFSRNYSKNKTVIFLRHVVNNQIIANSFCESYHYSGVEETATDDVQCRVPMTAAEECPTWSSAHDRSTAVSENCQHTPRTLVVETF